MQLIRFGEVGNEKPGVLIDGKRKDLSSKFRDWDRDFFHNNGLNKIKEIIKTSSDWPDVQDDVRWASCIARPGKVICIGLNYSDHAKESEEPIIFQKGANTVVGPYDNILIPRNSKKTDWEVELGIVIGKNASYLESAEDAKDYIAGYCISHDVSEREFQLEKGGQWTKGKSCDNFNPLGPFMATSDELPDINNLSMELLVNGKQMQKGNTSFMIFDCEYVVYYLSQFMTLEAGDIISTGTPPGVGLGMSPPQFLKEKDVVEVRIEGLGMQKQNCVNA